MQPVIKILKDAGNIQFRDVENRILFIAPERSEVSTIVDTEGGDNHIIRITTPTLRTYDAIVNKRILFDDGTTQVYIGDDDPIPNENYNEFIVYDIADYLVKNFFISDEPDIINNVTNNITNNVIVGGPSSVVEFVAAENVAAYDLATSDGYIADSTDVTMRNKVIGIANSAVLSGNTGQATGFGEIQNVGWSWLLGSKIFLNGTSLSETPVSSGFSLLIGTAVASDTINVNIQPSILL